MNNIIVLRFGLLLLLSSMAFVTSVSYASSGFIVQSASLTPTIYPGHPNSQSQWIVTVSMNGGGQSLSGTLSNSTIASYCSGCNGTTPAYPLNINGQTNSEQALYIINNQPTPIYSFTTVVEYGSIKSGFLGFIGTNITSASPCPSSSGSGSLFSEWDILLSSSSLGWQILGSGQGTPVRVCIYEQPVAYEAGIGQINQIFTSQFSISANGKTEYLNISNSGQQGTQSATSPDGLIQANWDGSLFTGIGTPEASSVVAISNNQYSQNWIPQTWTDYNNWETQYSTSAGELKSQTFSPTSSSSGLPPACSSILPNASTSYLYSVGSCLVNNVADQYMSVNNNDASGLLQQVLIGGYPTRLANQGQDFLVTLPPSDFTSNPVITLRINASFLGVVIPKGKPEILSATSTPFNSGNRGTVLVDVENIGNVEGHFSASLSNCSGITPQTPPTPTAVAPGQSQEINISIFTSGINSNVNEECTVTVMDVNGGGSATAQVNVVMKQANQCTPGQQIVQGSSICSCVNNNGVYEPGACAACPYGVATTSSGTYICAAAPAPITNNTNNSSSSGPSISGSSQIVTAIVNDIVVPVASNFVVPAVCSSVGNPFGLCTGILDYLLSKI